MSLQRSAHYWRQHLDLIQHPEGGCYRETYRSPLNIPQTALSADFDGDRSVSTSIYFLLEFGELSALHRIASDELWHYYDGDCLTIWEITKGGELKKHLLGKHLETGAQPQLWIPAGSWFGSSIEDGAEYGFTLCGCTVAPGFDFADFELAVREDLLDTFPRHEETIRKLTHEK